MVRPGIAVFPYCAAEFGHDSDDCIRVGRTQTVYQVLDPVAQETKMIRQVSTAAPLIDMRIPAAERKEHQADRGISAEQSCQPRGVIAKTGRGGSTVVGGLSLLSQLSLEVSVRGLSLLVSRAEWIRTLI